MSYLPHFIPTCCTGRCTRRQMDLKLRIAEKCSWKTRDTFGLTLIIKPDVPPAPILSVGCTASGNQLR